MLPGRRDGPGPAAAYDPAAFLNYLGDHGLSSELDRPSVAPAPTMI
jgi:hypothetical protein